MRMPTFQLFGNNDLHFQCLQTLKNSLPGRHCDMYKNNMSVYTYCNESPSTLNKWFYAMQKSTPKDFITPDLLGRVPDHVLHICPTELRVNPRQTCDRDCLGVLWNSHASSTMLQPWQPTWLEFQQRFGKQDYSNHGWHSRDLVLFVGGQFCRFWRNTLDLF